MTLRQVREIVLGPSRPDPVLLEQCRNRRLGRPTARHLCSFFVTLHWLVLYPLALFVGGERPLTDYFDLPANWIVYDILRLYGEKGFAVWVIVATISYGILGWIVGAGYDFIQCRRFTCRGAEVDRGGN